MSQGEPKSSAGWHDLTEKRLQQLAEVEQRIGYRFEDRSRLDTALTHRSWANENGVPYNYERLEFLGDSVLGLITAEWLFTRLPDGSEGDLAARLSYLVSAEVLTQIGRELSLGLFVQFGVGEERAGGQHRDGLLADTVEAVLGGIYLDGGLEPVSRLVVPFLERELENSAGGRDLRKDPKTALQERSQASGGPLPEYRLVGEQGPDHAKRFLVECWVGTRRLGLGDGSTKKRAQRRAARRALKALDAAEGSEKSAKT